MTREQQIRVKKMELQMLRRERTRCCGNKHKVATLSWEIDRTVKEIYKLLEEEKGGKNTCV